MASAPRVEGTPGAPPAKRGFVPAFQHWAIVLTTIVLFGISGGLLWVVGVNYDGLSGGAASKIHPSTYLVVLIFVWMAWTRGNVLSFLAECAERRPGAAFLLVSTLVLFTQVVLRQAPGMAGILDTYLPAALAVFVMSRAEDRTLRQVEIAIHVIMLVNGLMALVEFGTGHLFFPYRFEGDVFATDLRSTALQGHPLVNATVTCWYTLSIISGGGRTLGFQQRTIIIVVQLLALVAFGGRIASVTTFLFGSLYGLIALHRALLRGRVSILASAVVVLLATLLPAIIAGLAVGGFFDSLISRFVSDGGSANARVEMLDLFSVIPFRELLIGPDAELVDSARRIAGLEWGIENPIVRTLLYQGLLVTLLQTVAVVFFLSDISRVMRKGTLLPMLAFTIVINTSESIGGKTTMLTKFVIMMLAFYPLGPTVNAAFRTVRERTAWPGRNVASHRP